MLANHTKVTLPVAQSMVRATYGTTIEPDLLTPVLDLALRYGLVSQHIPASALIWNYK